MGGRTAKVEAEVEAACHFVLNLLGEAGLGVNVLLDDILDGHVVRIVGERLLRVLERIDK